MSIQTSEDDHRSLAVKLDPRAGESLLGYIARLEEANIYQPGWLPRDLGLFGYSTSVNDGAITALSQMTDVAVNALRLMNVNIRAKESPFLGHKIVPSLLMHKGRRLCMECIREDCIHLNIWNFLPIYFCQKHLVPLISMCPQCSVPLMWGKSDIRYCCNGHNLLSAPTPASSDPSQREIEVANWLTDLMSEEQQKHTAPHPIFSSHIWDFARVSHFLMHIENFDYRCKNGRGRTLRDAISKGFPNAIEMVDEWPSLFSRHLPVDRARAIDLSMIDPHLHSILSGDQALAREYDEHMSFVLRRGLKRFFHLENPEDGISLVDASALLGLSHNEFMSRAKDQKWLLRGGHYHNRLFDRRKILAWQAASQSMSWMIALRVLGVSDHVMHQLTANGTIQKVGTFGDGKFVDLRRSDVEKVARLMAVQPTVPDDVDLTITVASASRVIAKYGVQIGDLVAAAVGGSIAVYGSEKGALSDVKLLYSDVLKWLRASRPISEKTFVVTERKLLRATEKTRTPAVQLERRPAKTKLPTLKTGRSRAHDLAPSRIAAE